MTMTRQIFMNFSTLKLVIVRHGQSQSNLSKVWSGWSDSKLTPKGETHALQCGKLLKQQGLEFDLTYCSYLSRTIKTLNLILQASDSLYLPTRKRWRLNQKFYGALQDEDKMKIVHQYGLPKVQQWRRSYTVAPPLLPQSDPRHPIHDKRYKDLDPALLPSGEHLGHLLERVRVLYEEQIKLELQKGKRLLLVCHGNVVRVLTNLILGFTQTQASEFNLPNGVPLLIELDSQLKVQNWGYVGDQSRIQRKIKKLQNQLKE